MAEGGDFGYEDNQLDFKLDHDDQYDQEREVDTTRPFQPNAASTPYQTMMHEQSGMPDTSYEETPLLRRTGSIGDLQRESALRQKMKNAVDMIKAKFPSADFEIMKIRRGSGKNTGNIVAIGTRGGEYKILKDDGSDLTKSFLDSFKKKLGPRAEEILLEDRNTIQEQRQRLAEAENQERLANALAAEKEKEEQEIENLRQQVERTQTRIDALQEEHGSNLESEAELNRLKQLKKNYQKDLDSKKKKVVSLEKEAKNKEKAKASADRERVKLAQIEKKKKRNRRKTEQHKGP